MSELIFSVRFDNDFGDEGSGFSVDPSEMSVIGKLLDSSRKNNPNAKSSNTASRTEHLITNVKGIEYVPDLQGLKKAERMIEKAKRFSSRHHVSADIFRQKASVVLWFYFSTDILTGEKKEDFVKLLDLADEITGIAHPKEIGEECEFAVILNCNTHRCFVSGREIKPL